MEAAKQRHWSNMQERGTLLGMRILLTSYRLLGRWGLWVFMFPVVFYFYVSGKSGRTASIAFLNQVNRYLQREQTAGFWQGLKLFCSFADSAFDKIDAWQGAIGIEDIEYSNIEAFRELVESSSGAVLIGSHLGNLEVCRALSFGRYATRINVLVFTAHAVKFNDLLSSISSNVNLNLIQVTELSIDFVIELKERVERGEMVVIVGDRTSTSTSGRVVYADFLGKPAPFPEGPFILASLLECRVYLLFCLKDKDRFKVVFEPFSGKLALPRKHRKQVLQSCVERYAQSLSSYAAQYPYQWFNFYNFWQEDDKVQRQQ